ncbi:hypothetical protein IE53DRAFT_386379 [Violaceomyces palustris]|uniref:Uncharacterized protein n=1 Tax=Violaceomyces palustris TaxID=1673888 RepID=A0ACD0NZQ8_9BASI|nr:hypothetical protein IE53DRAFT_386379 [Violaceomyces palustris]
MPTVKIVNKTNVPLHVALKHISPIYYANSVQPDDAATFKVGRVWFTIQARIDRGDNGYDKFQQYAPIAVVTVGALSLGAGAVYFAGASAAAGGTTAAIAAISARVSASVATHLPTVKRLYKYAKKGNTAVKMGQVVGIGGTAVAKSQKAKGSADKGQEESDSELISPATRKKAEKRVKKSLKKLLQGSVVSSAGWYMKQDRTLCIVGGPRASRMEDGLLVIETDTEEPFRIIDEAGLTVASGNQDGDETRPDVAEATDNEDDDDDVDDDHNDHNDLNDHHCGNDHGKSSEGVPDGVCHGKEDGMNRGESEKKSSKSQNMNVADASPGSKGAQADGVTEEGGGQGTRKPGLWLRAFKSKVDTNPTTKAAPP